MPALPQFSEGQLEQISRVLGECGTGSDIGRIFTRLGIADTSGESTKWRRLYATFGRYQEQERAPSKLIDYIRIALDPASWVNRPEEFESYRTELNILLAFAGLQFGADGQFRFIDAVTTITQAHERAQTLQSKFKGRRIHAEVTKYCRPELLQANYFHAVFEASKGLAQRIRDLSGVKSDGALLIDTVFSIERPILALNSLQTETEKSEHKGFAMLLKGAFGAVRNPLAHEPKILWKGEDDAADYLSLISLLHRKLDDCVKTGFGGSP